MKWPKKIRHISSVKEYIFYQDCHPLEFAWYIGDNDVFLTKVDQDDLDSGQWLGWDDDFDWTHPNKSDTSKNSTDKKQENFKIEPCKWGHTWKKYVGFSEVYEYCVHCDIKKT